MDAVFRDEVDQSTYSLYIGCGGCVSSQDPIVIAPMQLNGYQPAELEPFTQTRYSSVFPKAQRKYNSSGLRYDVCSEGHFTIRLVDHMNRTDGSTLVWGAVIGLGETFTFLELLSFPLFVIRNHGDTWNEQAWTFWVVLFLVAPFTLVGIRWSLKMCGFRPLESKPVKMQVKQGTRLGAAFVIVDQSPRVALYELALLGFLAAFLEIVIHTFYAQVGAPISYGLWVSLLGVGAFANGVPIWFVTYVWRISVNYRRNPENRRRPQTWTCGGYFPADWHTYYMATGHPGWAPLEFLTGFSFLFFFGAGFFLGPASVMLAALFRHVELYRWYMGKPLKNQRLRVTMEVDMGEAASLLVDEVSQRPLLPLRA